MNKVNIFFDKNKKLFKVCLNKSTVLFNVKMFIFNSDLMSLQIYNFLFILRILSRFGFVKPLKKF